MKDYEEEAQKYRQLADDHMAAVKFSIKSFLITGIVLIPSLAVIAALTLSWFASSNKVDANAMQVIIDNPQFELRSYGTSGTHDDMLKQLLGTDGEKNFWYSTTSPRDTEQDKPAVNWLLNEQSNMNNYDAEDSVDWTQDKRTDYAIEPGASGDIQFYIVPKTSGDLHLTCTLNLIPYHYENKNLELVPDDNFVQDQIAGHVLFFLKDENSLAWIKDKTFSISIPDAVPNQEYLYTIHWSWIQTFGEIILSNQEDTYLNGRLLSFSKYDNGQDIRDAIVAEMKDYPEKFFYSSLTRLPLNTGYGELQFIDNLHEKSTVELMEAGNNDAMQAFVDLSSYFNQTDQFIGKNVDCLRVSLVAELANVEE